MACISGSVLYQIVGGSVEKATLHPLFTSHLEVPDTWDDCVAVRIYFIFLFGSEHVTGCLKSLALLAL